MWVLQTSSDGRSASARASSVASAIARRSWPSSVRVCQPRAWKRLATSSLKVIDVEPSIEIELSS